MILDAVAASNSPGGAYALAVAGMMRWLVVVVVAG